MTHEQSIPVSEQDTVHLYKQSAVIDVHKEIVPTTEIGLPTEDDQHKFSVVGELTLSGTTDAPASLALIRTINKKSGLAELFLTGIVKDDQGNKAIAAGWESIAADTKYTVGRTGDDDSSKRKITGTALFGTDFSLYVSRDHLTLELNSDGKLTVEDTSGNASDLHANIIEHGTSDGISPSEDADSLEMIDHVPLSGEEAAAMLEKERVAKLKPKIDKIDEQIAQFQARLDSVRKRFSNDEGHNLFLFALHKHRQGVEQRRGRADAAKAHEEEAGKAYKALPAEAQAMSSEYRYALDEKTVLLERKASLLDK